MNFLIVGINHQTADITIREKVAFAPEHVMAALNSMIYQHIAEEALILSTCNRTEIYSYSNAPPEKIYDWLMRYHNQSIPERYFYTYKAEDAVRHAMRVACGLDSLILGEPQILGQLKSAYTVSQDAGTLGDFLERMFQHTFAAAKKVRTQTAIGQSPVSVAFAAVQLAQQLFTHLHTKTALLIGAGKTIELVYKHLRENCIAHIILANRTQTHAYKIASDGKSQVILLGEIHRFIHNADIIISSTASQLPILGKGAVEKALRWRKHRPILMIDIAVPRDIEPEVADLPDIYLYSVDDLQTVISDNLQSRQEAAKIAEQIIFDKMKFCLSKLRERSAACTLKHYREQSEALKEQEVQRALKLIASGKPFEQVLQQFANSLTNKLIHLPCAAIRKASSQGEIEKINWARELLGLTADTTLSTHENIHH